MIQVKQNDTRPLEAKLAVNSVAIGLAGATVRFHMRPRTPGVGSTVNGLCTIVDAAAGRVRYAWLPADVDTPGLHRAEFEVTFGDGTVETFPNDGWLDVEILAELD